MRGGEAPPGIRLLRSLRRSCRPGDGGEQETRRRRRAFKYLVLILTFVAYACYHASRKPTSIVKSVLDPDPPPAASGRLLPWPAGEIFLRRSADELHRKKEGWPPFDGDDGTVKLGEIDLAFLVFYSLGMYLAGHLGDSLDLRLFLAAGMIASGCFVALFGMGFFWSIHNLGFYIAMQVLAGLFQATGWPSVVAVVGNWFGKRKRGLIMGIWNAHTSVGNISGSLLAASVLDHGWGWSFLLPGGLIAIGGAMVYLFLPAYPEDVGLPSPHGLSKQAEAVAKDEEAPPPPLPAAKPPGGSNRGNAVGIAAACKIPGVVPFAMCLFFSKLVAYTFLYWLPFYLSQTGVLAGYISDRLRARATTAASFMYLAIPSLFAYRHYGGSSKAANVALMMVSGLFVNGPYALITTAVSADLGTHSSLRGNSRALATVAAIIDGTGSAGAAIGPLLTGVLSRNGWGPVFLMLMVGAFVAGALLSFLVKAEIMEILRRRRWKPPPAGDPEGEGKSKPTNKKSFFPIFLDMI
ncbi:unnamed protein product [Spirodela intermedia]|uniref:Major facilitator superfamily (MFS) profile domain-containing protein n=1 Tax=Spirodela intermedia TaxID=51605 RepID=A0A7I8JJN6_SPIIN|nr:unnamed protein product [Spirodela intermedia]CAA6669793.1 unnamed protein product [Spirodela intermedia]